MLRFACLAAIAAIVLSSPAAAQESDGEAASGVQPGEYRDRSSFEVFHGLILREDGTYEWAIAAGAMDRRSSGTWEVHGEYVVLTTTPAPVSPVFEREEDDTSEDAPFLMVRWPNGNGIFGIDFTITCADGKRIAHYTQSDGWDLVPGECDEPESISLEEPIQDIGPAYFDLRERNGGLRFTLVPNDFGVMDLTGTQIRPTANGIELWMLESAVEMVRVDAE